MGHNQPMPGLYDHTQNKNMTAEHVMYLSGQMSGQLPAAGFQLHPSYMQQNLQQQIQLRQGQPQQVSDVLYIMRCGLNYNGLARK